VSDSAKALKSLRRQQELRHRWTLSRASPESRESLIEPIERAPRAQGADCSADSDHQRSLRHEMAHWSLACRVFEISRDIFQPALRVLRPRLR